MVILVQLVIQDKQAYKVLLVILVILVILVWYLLWVFDLILGPVEPQVEQLLAVLRADRQLELGLTRVPGELFLALDLAAQILSWLSEQLG